MMGVINKIMMYYELELSVGDRAINQNKIISPSGERLPDCFSFMVNNQC